jgi:hypothetical protein
MSRSRDMMSLCRRVGFYRGPLDPDTGPCPDDHKECRRLLDREATVCAEVVEALAGRDSRDPVTFRSEMALVIQAEGGPGAVLAAARDVARHKPGSLQAAVGDVLVVRYNKGGRAGQDEEEVPG